MIPTPVGESFCCWFDLSCAATKEWFSPRRVTQHYDGDQQTAALKAKRIDLAAATRVVGWG